MFALLSFTNITSDENYQDLPLSPQRSFSNHRGAITAIALGHSFANDNIAVSASKDNTCIVWDYFNGDLLHTFLLSLSPRCLTLDPVDRAVYAGYDDGSIQFIDFYSQESLWQPLRDPDNRSTPTQPPPSAKWLALDHPGSATLCLQVSYDGTTVLSGHQDGKIHTWDVAAGRYGKKLVDFSAPVTNLQMLKPSGISKTTRPPLKLHNVIKPHYESFADGAHRSSGAVAPSNYTFTAQFTSKIHPPGSRRSAQFRQALTDSSFPTSLVDEYVTEFTAWQNPSKTAPSSSDLAALQAQNATLSAQLDDATTRERTALAKVREMDREAWRRQKDAEIRAAKKKQRRLGKMTIAERERKEHMGEIVDDGDEEMGDHAPNEGDLSSSTDELSDHF